jgi:sn-glycerol 3-phosphate transport system substrate-binding protein
MPTALTGSGSTPTGNKLAIQNEVNAFNTLEGGKIIVTDTNESGGYGQLWNDYWASLANGTSPQVMMFDQYNAQAAEDSVAKSQTASSILPISTCLTANKVKTTPFSKKLLGSYTIKGKLVGMPYSASIPVMYYNTQAFTAAHITSPPTTMAELATDQQKLITAGYKDGVSLKFDPWEITTWLGINDSSVVNESNGHAGRASASAFGNNSAILTYMTDLQNIAKAAQASNHSWTPTNPSASGINAYENLLEIATGQSGIAFDTTAALGSILDFLPSYPKVTLGVAPIPTLTGKVKGGTPPGGNGLFINASNSSPAQEAASWAFINFLTSAKQMATWDAATGYLPIRSDEVKGWKSDLTNMANFEKKVEPSLVNIPKWFGVGYTALSVGPANSQTEGPMIGAYDAVNSDMETQLEGLLTPPSGAGSWELPAEVLSDTTTAVNTSITNYNNGL